MTQNIVLIVLDTVRKDSFDHHMPRLQELADISFEQCRAASAWSVPSHASMMTGKLPHQHGIHTHNRDFSRLDRDETFLCDLSDHEIVGTSANVYAGSPYGFDELFDEFIDISPTHRFPDGLDVRKFGIESERTGMELYLDVLRASFANDHPVESLGNAVLSKLYHLSRKAAFPALLDDGASIVSKAATNQISETSEPCFQFVNFMDAHGPLQHVWGYDQSLHSAPNSWSSSDYDKWEVVAALDEHDIYLERYRGLYAAAVDYLDQKVAAFIDRVQELTDQETTFVVTADHGENLGYPEDEGLLDHTSSLTEALLHVPLIVVNPPSDPRPVKGRGSYFSHLELGEFLGGLLQDDVQNVLSEEIPAEVVGRTANVPPKDNKEWWNRAIRCVYRNNSKFVWDSLGNQKQYEIREQNGNQNAPQSPDRFPSFEKHFKPSISHYKQTVIQEDETASTLDQGARNRLQDLGYL